MTKKRYLRYPETAGLGSRYSGPLDEYVTLDVAEREAMPEAEDACDEEEETPDVLEMMSGRKR